MIRTSMLPIGFLAFVVLGAALVIVGYGERKELRKELLESHVSESDHQVRADRATSDLSGALNLTPGSADQGRHDHVDALLDTFGPGSRPAVGEAELSLGWDRLPRLFAWIAAHPEVPLARLDAGAGVAPGTCRVHLRFDLPASGYRPR